MRGERPLTARGIGIQHISEHSYGNPEATHLRRVSPFYRTGWFGMRVNSRETDCSPNDRVVVVVEVRVAVCSSARRCFVEIQQSPGMRWKCSCHQAPHRSIDSQDSEKAEDVRNLCRLSSESTYYIRYTFGSPSRRSEITSKALSASCQAAVCGRHSFASGLVHQILDVAAGAAGKFQERGIWQLVMVVVKSKQVASHHRRVNQPRLASSTVTTIMTTFCTFSTPWW